MVKEKQTLLTGAEVVAMLMKQAGIEYVFAYPGTSELVLCDAILRTSGLTLINGRGDKESAFMAAGGSLLQPTKSAALLHGARGLTNAAGAIADAYRNEVGTVFFVGLPSTASAPFLPPHGEKDLIKGIGTFVKKAYELHEKVIGTDTQAQAKRKITVFIKTITEGITTAQQLPIGPTIIGVPQDIMEDRWVPMDAVKDAVLPPSNQKKISPSIVEQIVHILKKKKHPVILIDDYLFKDLLAKDALVGFANALGAPIVQIQYLRGPMLFEKLSPEQNPYFVGSYMVENPYHKELMEHADVLILLEERNAYERIVGKLPHCQKISITSNPAMTKKNAYLTKNDLLVSGKVSEILTAITNKVTPREDSTVLEYYKTLRNNSKVKSTIDEKYLFMRQDIGEVLGAAFKKVQNPVLVDDSQMFGGLLFESYDKFPSNVRIFGDHGAFIGGGIATAAGLARCNYADHTIFCTIGDQSFTNAIQGLIAVAQEHMQIVYIVCNNGKSVSLTKQILSQDTSAFDHGKDTFLYNVPNFDYAQLAKEIGLNSYKVVFNLETSKRNTVKETFEQALTNALLHTGPSLIELVLPSDPAAWEGIWITKGKEVLTIKKGQNL